MPLAPVLSHGASGRRFPLHYDTTGTGTKIPGNTRNFEMEQAISVMAAFNIFRVTSFNARWRSTRSISGLEMQRGTSGSTVNEEPALVGAIMGKNVARKIKLHKSLPAKSL
jgi:hypothetical protein